jgi:hypothetical protein
MDSSPDKYRNQIKEAWSELYSLESAQRKIAKRIEDVRALIRATANFLPKDERFGEQAVLDIFQRPTNIAEAVKVTLAVARFRKNPVPLTPTQIREHAEHRGFSFAGYTNPMASIHTILRRMKEADPPEVDYDEDAGTYLLKNATDLMSPAVGAKMVTTAWERVIKHAMTKPSEPERIRELLNRVFDEVADETYVNTFGKDEEGE